MFGRGAHELMEALPKIGDLDASMARRLLSGAWLAALDHREFGGSADPSERVEELRRLGTALEVHAVVVPSVDKETRHACAFVAAEAFDIARGIAANSQGEDELDAEHRAFEGMEIGLLYMVAGYDANANVIRENVEVPEHLGSAQQYAIRATLALMGLSSPVEPPEETLNSNDPLRERVREGLWREIGDCICDHLRWIRDPSQENEDELDRLRALSHRLAAAESRTEGAAHGDIHHLAILLAFVIEETTRRALRSLLTPGGDDGRFAAFVRARCRTEPLMWPAAAIYAQAALPGPSKHAVITVPTGAGKSGVADLAIAQAVSDGWVLVLAPTNALTGQIRRQLGNALGEVPGVSVREFIGASEYSAMDGDAPDQVSDRQVLVMTPEKCSLALRQIPEAFERLSLCVVDEAHQFGERGERAVLAELVLSEILYRAPDVSMLMMSALIANPGDLSAWLQEVTHRDCVIVDVPWRPTRTLRAVAGYDGLKLGDRERQARTELAALPPSRVNVEFTVPVALVAGLQGSWSSRRDSDYMVARTDIEFPATVTRPKGKTRISRTSAGYVRPAVQALAQRLGELDHRVMAFLPRSKHDSFAAAIGIEGFGPRELDFTVECLLNLAEAELGAPTLLRDVLLKGAGVHTSALLAEERRASEIAFEEGDAKVLFATGTLAQGLNLPATAVIIGGTKIGDDRGLDTYHREAQKRAQLLNAIGRSGRPRVAARSVAIVVPDEAVRVADATIAHDVLPRAQFLADEDASTHVSSQLRRLVVAAMGDNLEAITMTRSEQVAFTVLTGSDRDTAVGTLRSSWGARQAGAVAQAQQVASAIEKLGRDVLELADAPSWVAVAAHRAGVSLSLASAAMPILRESLQASVPGDIRAWADVLWSILSHAPVSVLGEAVREASFTSTAIQPIFGIQRTARDPAWAAMRRTVDAWLQGLSITDIADALHNEAVRGTSGRGPRDPLPRTLRAVQNGLVYDIAGVAGLLSALVDTGDEYEPEGIWALDAESRLALDRFPAAVRLGAADPIVLALLRAGARPRCVAHLVARTTAPPPADLDDEGLLDWARATIRALGDDLFNEDRFARDEARMIAWFVNAHSRR